jgi:hypothetical protein
MQTIAIIVLFLSILFGMEMVEALELLMNLLLIRSYPIVVIDNQIRNDYINALFQGNKTKMI